MITGVIIFISGMIVGLLINKVEDKRVKKVVSFINREVFNKKAQVVDMSPDIEI